MFLAALFMTRCCGIMGVEAADLGHCERIIAETPIGAIGCFWFPVSSRDEILTWRKT